MGETVLRRDPAAIRRWVGDHLSLVIPAAVVFLTFVRVAVVASGDPITMRALIDSAGPTTVLMALLIEITAYMGVLIGFVVAESLPFRYGRWAVFGVCFLVSFFLAPSWLFVSLLILSVIVPIVSGWALGKELEEAEGELEQIEARTRTFGIASVLFLLAGWTWLLLANRDPWMAPELIETTRGDLVGYIVKVDQDWYSVLTERDRHIEYIPSESVIARTVCSLGVWRQLDRPVYFLLATDTPDIDECPTDADNYVGQDA